MGSLKQLNTQKRPPRREAKFIRIKMKKKIFLLLAFLACGLSAVEDNIWTALYNQNETKFKEYLAARPNSTPEEQILNKLIEISFHYRSDHFVQVVDRVVVLDHEINALIQRKFLGWKLSSYEQEALDDDVPDRVVGALGVHKRKR